MQNRTNATSNSTARSGTQGKRKKGGGGGEEGRVYSTGGAFFLDFIYYYLSDRKDTQYC